jgi:hypothetical protein
MQSRAAGSLEPFDRALGQLRLLFSLLEGAAQAGPRPVARDAEEPAAPVGAGGDPAGWRAW